ncbi:RHS repeat-associated core domain-containing protein [Candidatus Electrothrix aarhusensis]|uniref:RHS repeat-associated core domain-containing protein n=1 Tax=Candidatus Electrothrix aarhusensis TaxID=1859131 RepID=A0A3S4T6S4_9BACT|nr:RHS repeat-associated core domain-containing protein [Candidatus Electrothrix aarhusensis]
MLNGQHTDYYRGAGNHLALMHQYKGGTQGQMYWYHYNNKGDVAGLTKHNGNSHHNYRYDPYGAVLPENGNFTDPHNHYTLTGKEFDENTGLVWFGSRHYEPETGVWMGQDSYRGMLDDPMSLHRYGYVGNNPLIYFDLYGYFGWRDVGNLALAGLDFVSGVAKAFGAGIALGTGQVATSGSLASAAISDLDDSSKELSSFVNNGLGAIYRNVTGNYVADKSPDEIEGIFSPVTDSKWLKTPMNVNQTAWNVKALVKSSGSIIKGVRNLSGKVRGIYNTCKESDTISDVWRLNPFKRGKELEKIVGQNLPDNYPVIDKFKDGIATSIKSLDVNAKSYQTNSTLMRTVKGYIDKAKAFQGRKWAGANIKPHEISGRALDLIIPSGGNSAQKDILQRLIKYGKDVGVKVNVLIK